MASFATATVLQIQVTSQPINAARFSLSFEHPASTKLVPLSRQSLSLCKTFCSRLPAVRGGSSRLQCSLSSETKISIAKEFISSDSGVIKPELLAAEFVFEGPVVGPLPKKEYLEAVGTFDLKKAFPDSKTNANNFLVDGDDPDLVRFTTRFTGTHTGPLNFFGTIHEGEGVKVTSATEAASVKLNAEGKITKFTTGYVVDRSGNTGGLGALFGIMHAIGHPVKSPEASS